MGRIGLWVVAGMLGVATACGGKSTCEQDVDLPECDPGFEAVALEYQCANEIGVSEWICVPEAIGSSCAADDPVDEACDDDLLCVTEPDQPNAIAGTCLPLCTSVNGRCDVFGSAWTCVTTNNGPDVCAADFAQ